VSENNQLRDVFDAIADPTRCRLIRLLAEAVSKHFTILKDLSTIPMAQAVT
jgi:DNA-binding transcriptional ArsR family regulator